MDIKQALIDWLMFIGFLIVYGIPTVGLTIGMIFICVKWFGLQ